MKLSIDSTLTLRGGVALPRLGLGVYRAAEGGEVERAVRTALELGYRHVDTAAFYGNERGVGEALRSSGLAREDVFVTTKVWNDDQGYEGTLAACRASLERLGLERVDLYLVHWPVPHERRETWRAMERLLEDGAARAVGVSNYTVAHLDELLAECRVPPAVNQVELSPFLQQRELVRFCHEHDIAVEAYSPLTRGRRLDDARLVALARRLDRTPAQVLVRWALDSGLAPLPKSADPARIAENAAVFDFELDGETLAEMQRWDEGSRVAWDPTGLP